MKKYHVFAVALCMATLGGCAVSPSSQHDDTNMGVAEINVMDATVEAVMAANQKNHAKAEDVEYSASDATMITLNGDTATVDGAGAESVPGHVTINAQGTYILSGTYTGDVVVEAGDADTIKLVLNGVTIQHDGSALRAVSGNELVIITADGTRNTLTDTQAQAHAENAEDETVPSGTLESHIDTTMGGHGDLVVHGGKNALSSSDGLTIYSGTFTLTSADDGIRGKDYVWIEGGTISVLCAGDAIQSTNDTETERGFIYIAGGAISVSESEKAIDAKTDLVIVGGSIDVNATDDALEAAYVVLAGGSGEISSGDDPVNATSDTGNPWIAVLGGDWVFDGVGDGFDSNGAALMSGGSVQVYGPEHGGNGAIDTETGLTMVGGTLFAIGSQGMDEGPRLDSSQGTVKFTGDFAVGDELVIKDDKENVLGTFTNRSRGQSIFFSAPHMQVGQQYVLYVNGVLISEEQAGDYDENRMGMPGGNHGGGMPDMGGMPPEDMGKGERPNGMLPGEDKTKP